MSDNKISESDLNRVIKMYRHVQGNKIVMYPPQVNKHTTTVSSFVSSSLSKVNAIISHTQNPEYVIRYKYQIKITFKHMNKLRATNIEIDDEELYLNDDIMIYLLGLLQDSDKYQVISKKKHTMDLFLHSYFITQLLNGQNLEIEKQILLHQQILGVDIKDMGFIYVIINLTVVHWTMLAIDIQNNIMSHYDSLRGSRSAKISKIKEIMTKMEATLSKFGIVGQWSNFCQAECPCQNNGVDCGVMALLAIDKLYQKLPLDYNPEDVANFRVEIARRILNSSSSNLSMLGPSTKFLNYRAAEHRNDADDIMGKQNTYDDIFNEEEKEEQQSKKKRR